jgi:hypothetical protein
MARFDRQGDTDLRLAAVTATSTRPGENLAQNQILGKEQCREQRETVFTAVLSERILQ